MPHTEECKKSSLAINESQRGYVCEIFKMLGDTGRLQIVCALMGTQMCVAHLAEQVGMEQSALSHQLKNLRQAGLVRSERKGRQVFYGLDDEHVYHIIQQTIAHVEHTRAMEAGAVS